jgi:hypothetical protein
MPPGQDPTDILKRWLVVVVVVVVVVVDAAVQCSVHVVDKIHVWKVTGTG